MIPIVLGEYVNNTISQPVSNFHSRGTNFPPREIRPFWSAHVITLSLPLHTSNSSDKGMALALMLVIGSGMEVAWALTARPLTPPRANNDHGRLQHARSLPLS